MACCILCLNNLDDNEALQIDECYAGSFSGREMIKSHFEFYERIFDDTNDPKCVCGNCWSHLVDFNEFHLNVATNYGMTEEIQPEIKDEDPIIDERNIVEWEEYVDHVDYEPERVEALEEVIYDEIIEEKKPEIDENYKVIDLPVPRPQRRTAPPPIDPADDEKIRQVANMNCEICFKLLDSLAQARAHFRHEHGMIGYLTCCGRKFKQRNRLLDHVNTHFNLSYPCQVCGKTFDSKAYLVRHMVYHDDVKLYECDHCPKTFAKKFLVRNHLLSVHIFEKVEPSYECPIEGCGKVFVNEARLKHHLKYTHVSPETHVCTVCSKSFKTKAAIDEHMRIHTRKPEDRYQCNICGHYISELKTFKRHVRNHDTEALDNTCHYCGKKSPNLNALKKHIRYVHETERVYQCRYCDKSFKRPRNCIDHEASVHTMQDLYECPYCPRTFRNQSNMLAHRKKAHPEHYKQPAYLLDAEEIVSI